MSMMRCDPCDHLYDSDFHSWCPLCEKAQDEEEAYYRQLYEGEKQAGLVGHRKDVPVPPPDPRTREYWGLK